MKKKDRYTISELAREFEISTRTIRYYEEIGLLNPERTPGNQRIFSRKDRAKLKLILRGRRLGFSLEEIREMIEMYDVAGEPEQIRLTLKYGEKKLKEIEEKIRELELLKEDLLNLREMLVKRLEELEKGS
ncbi:MerR family transcriptional regulator [Archaeoglobus fulgidus]|jgi:DNA-binding transcriptional MerR regulator|uniref:Mercuric resistance operon regulatory protein (MerR) n=2 Tax=Archaeoglobus fulgidus TaxID=2234 RepID=O29584_ARCFU|nr:MerR family transcriptional regulator [Archaeoglobus fulgidus]AAB90568.1 mercuric resistance operon regulatory protein (merR) [Archaeoglobus fulgidus DSM 4304]AIG97551.1 putative transcriptional regulator [Archaeoglobus fulgidus DSM 8774]